MKKSKKSSKQTNNTNNKESRNEKYKLVPSQTMNEHIINKMLSENFSYTGDICNRKANNDNNHIKLQTSISQFINDSSINIKNNDNQQEPSTIFQDNKYKEKVEEPVIEVIYTKRKSANSIIVKETVENDLKVEDIVMIDNETNK